MTEEDQNELGAKLVELLDDLCKLLGIDESLGIDEKISNVLEKVVYYTSLGTFNSGSENSDNEKKLEIKEKLLEIKEKFLLNRGELKNEDVNNFRSLIENVYKELEKAQIDLFTKERLLSEKERSLAEREAQLDNERKKLMDYMSMAKQQYIDLLDEEIRRKEEDFNNKVKILEQKERQLRNKAQSMILQELGQMDELIKEEMNIKKIRTGIKKLDDLLKGGIPMGSNTMMVGPPFCGREELSLLMEVSMVQRGLPLVIISFDKPAKIILEELRVISPIIDVYVQLNRLFIIDTFSLSAGLERLDSSGIIYIQTQTETKSVIEAADNVVRNFNRGVPPVFFMYGITSLMNLMEKVELIRFFQVFTTKRKSEQTISFYLLDNANVEDQDVQALAHLMDGLILFKKEGSKSYLQVQGLTDVESRDWIETEFTKTSFSLKSFTLSKIR